MKDRLFYLLLLLFILTSCKDEKAELLAQFNQMYLNSTFEEYPAVFNAASSKFYNSITHKNNLNVDSMVAIGIRYDVPYFATSYLASCGDHMKESVSQSDFFYYLTAQEVSFYNKDKNYEVLEKKSRLLEKEAWVAIIRQSGDAKALSWANYTKENGAYKYNLIQNIQLQEKKLKIRYGNFKKENPDLKGADLYKAIFSAYNNSDCSIAYFKGKSSKPTE